MAKKETKPSSPRASKAIRDRLISERRIEALNREKKLNSDLIDRMKSLEGELLAMTRIKNSRKSFSIKAVQGIESQATAVMVASDWHIEEVVLSTQVNDMNVFDKAICAERVRRFFRHGLKLVEKERHAVHIDTLVLAMIGDFISGSIHEELIEGNRLLPIYAIMEVQEYLAAGIQYILDNSDLKLVIPCHSGNHGRTTRQVHISTEAGNSLERMMYSSIAQRFANEKRVTFIISEGYHSYRQIYNTTIRFHHGHAVKYGGGVGGLTVPLNKAIYGWNRGHRADLDVLGHFHQFFDGGSFIVNGSLIGYNAYALAIKASPEPPVQAFFLIDSKFGKTVVCPIILEHDR